MLHVRLALIGDLRLDMRPADAADLGRQVGMLNRTVWCACGSRRPLRLPQRQAPRHIVRCSRRRSGRSRSGRSCRSSRSLLTNYHDDYVHVTSANGHDAEATLPRLIGHLDHVEACDALLTCREELKVK